MFKEYIIIKNNYNKTKQQQKRRCIIHKQIQTKHQTQDKKDYQLSLKIGCIYNLLLEVKIKM